MKEHHYGFYEKMKLLLTGVGFETFLSLLVGTLIVIFFLNDLLVRRSLDSAGNSLGLFIGAAFLFLGFWKLFWETRKNAVLFGLAPRAHRNFLEKLFAGVDPGSIFFTFAGAVVVIFCVVFLLYRHDFVKTAIETDGVITRTWYEESISSESMSTVIDLHIRIEFKVNGNVYGKNFGYREPGLYVGKKVKIYYRANDPGTFIFRTSYSDSIVAYVALPFGAIFFLIGFRPLFRQIKRNIEDSK